MRKIERGVKAWISSVGGSANRAVDRGRQPHGVVMRALIFSLVLCGLTLVSAAGLATEPHSWCITGKPMVQNGSNDPTTNAVVSYACNQISACCATGGRWNLSCVQKAATYALQNNLSGGDYCGRYAWAQGPIAGTGQFYPRDFNLFVVSGAVNQLRDTEGPVAASSGTSFAAFNLNTKHHEPIALLAGGPGATITQGTVNGGVIYSGGYSDFSVTYVDAPHPSGPAKPFPVDFGAAANKLIAMSQALAAYDTIPYSKQYGTITFSGSDPELNVFSVPATALTGTTGYTFAVPSTSNVIVNVTGASAAITNAGISGSISASQLLWNFPDARTLTLKSIAFVGSILAPKAAANLQNGSVQGTVVVASAIPALVELYSATYHVPSCQGALCVDPTWSSTAYINDNGTAADLANEAGFLEITGGPYVAEGQNRANPTNRTWYSFQPAQIQPKTKPLAVFFNGGPGAATSSLLFAFNTASWTVDPDVVGTSKILANTLAYWGQVANLLYIDAPRDRVLVPDCEL